MSSFMFVQTSCWTCPRVVKPLVTSGPFLKGSLELSFGGPVCGDSIAGGFLSQKLGLMFSFMFAL